MDQLSLPSYAKVNFTLDVGAKRPEDGYHYVNSVMLPISLADKVILRRAADMSVSSSPAIPGTPQENLALQAAQLLKSATGYVGGVSIHIDKAVPVAGGLAGGSTNAATVLCGLNQLWGTQLSEHNLIDLAIHLGSDVPFFVTGRPARVEGIGERLTPLTVSKPVWLVLVVPDVVKSTGNVYRMFDELDHVARPDTAAMRAALAAGDLHGMAGALGNVFEQVMLPRHPQIAEAKAALLREGALGALMSGAGPSVFGIVPDEQAGREIAERLSRSLRRVYLVHTRGHQG
jgi:4-diphosphocytidyl-2-C-methyl-D-erythritol kinase